MIDLDHNATTRPTPGVVEGVLHALREAWHNPSSVHRGGQAARARVELAREQIAALLAAHAREVTFTGSGTESIDLAIRGTLARLPAPKRVLVTTPVEHAAVRDLASELAKAEGVEVRPLPVDPGGLVDPADVARLAQGAGLVSVQWANNETGAIQPIREIAEAARRAGCVVHVDATQWVGKEPADVGQGSGAWCDLLTCSAHKFHGPKGVGVLWARSGLGLRPRLLGTQELGRRGGTENVPGIVGAGLAADEARAWLADPALRAAQRGLRDLFESRVLAGAPGLRVNGPPDAGRRLWNTTNIAFPRLEAEAVLLLLSERGVNASAGAACSSGSLEPSPVLLAMGVPPEYAHGSVRFSLSRETTRDEIEHAATIVAQGVRTLAAGVPPAREATVATRTPGQADILGP
ncbi:MAG: cysteine desulfurase family protein [Planctomycetota bacterium]|nr:cysteine desulfurase family protein [Planctomycetota bacterium]